MKIHKFIAASLVMSSLLMTGCSAVKNINAGNVESFSAIQTVSFGEAVDVEIATKDGIKTEKISVSTPQKSLNISEPGLPNAFTSSWYVFDITGADELSDVYATDIYGNTINYEASEGNTYLGRVFKLENGQYGMLIPNGFNRTTTDENGNIKLTGREVNVRIGNTVFTAERK